MGVEGMMGSDRAGRRRPGVGGRPAPPDTGDDSVPPDALYAWFFRAEYAQVVRTVSLVLDDASAAEDVAQEAFLRLHLHWSKVHRYDRPDAWVRRVALNLAASRARREGRRAGLERLSTRMGTGAPDSVTAVPDRPEQGGPVRDALLALPHKQRALVVLYYYEDRPLTEAGALLGLTPGSAKVTLHRARRRLQQVLESRADGGPGDPGALEEAGDA
jgi:RNA polymerase sigma-70 factor (ECF subfamily)